MASTSNYLIGEEITSIKGSKLPSNRQVLGFLLYTNIIQRDIQESAKFTYDEIAVFWSNANVKTKTRTTCIKKIVDLFHEYTDLKRNKPSVSRTQVDRRNEFSRNLDNLFNIAVPNALELLTDESEREFFIGQLKDGRPTNKPGLDIKPPPKLKTPERSTTSGVIPKVRRVGRDHRMSAAELSEALKSVLTPRTTRTHKTVDKPISETDDDDDDDSRSPVKLSKSEKDPEFKPDKKRTPKIEIITERVAGILDKGKISNPVAMHLICAILDALALPIDNYKLSVSTISRKRSTHRLVIDEKIRNNFQIPDGAVVHWDGKLMKTILRKKVDRLPVKVTHKDIDQLLGVPISAGTGKADAECVHEQLRYWRILDKVQACCFDTTSTNTGHLNGAGSLLELLLGRSLLYLPCRHHIYELILKQIFETKVSVTKGPDVQLFLRFQDEWENICNKQYEAGTKDKVVYDSLKDCIKDTDIWILKQLQKKQIRGDYKEFLELALLFIGGELPLENTKRTQIFRRPGPVHHARWMAKAIYCLKLFMFRSHFKLTVKELNGIREVCIFIIQHYLKLWFSCVSAVGAPLQDLTFVQTLLSPLTKNLDSKMKTLLLKKMSNHLWYLSEEAIALSDDLKRKMAATLLEYSGEDLEEDDEYEPSKKFTISMKNISDLIDKDLSYFVTRNTLNFFQRFKISLDFLEMDPKNWKTNEAYMEAFDFLNKMKVVNDTAERGVKLMEEYNNILTQNEEERQFILQVVAFYIKTYPSYAKKDLMSPK